LLKRIQGGDGQAFEVLLEQYSGKALRTAYLITGRKDIIEDAVQEAFVQCYRKIKGLRDPATFETWFYRLLTRNLPTYLPEGYKLISMTGDRQEKSDRGFVSVVYGVPKEAGKRLLLTITNERNFLRGGNAVQEVKVRGKTAYWAEFPIMEINGASKEPAVKVGHTLKWEDKGLAYKLEDSSGALSLEEMLKITPIFPNRFFPT